MIRYEFSFLQHSLTDLLNWAIIAIGLLFDSLDFLAEWETSPHPI